MTMALGLRSGCRAAGVTALLGVALVAAACGSSSSSTPPSSAAGAPSTSASSALPTGAVVGTATSSLGTYLTGAAGRALYIWVADRKGRPRCYAACAVAWPPLITKGAPRATGGAVAAHLGTITRSDSRTQVTYAGWPLYYYVGDTSHGMTRGNGSGQFGAKWWLISPSGGWVTPGG
jgi:predicted lipoprotein with Yx(FWY)xxD motif